MNDHVQPEPESDTPTTSADERKTYRLSIDLLALPRHVERLNDMLGEFLCEAPSDHPGPCRFAWFISERVQDQIDDEGDGPCWTQQVVDNITEHLRPIQVWSTGMVDRSLGTEPGSADARAPE